MRSIIVAKTPEETFQAGVDLSAHLKAGDMVLFDGELGAGKTTMIRGVLAGLDHLGPVRSPTFNLIQTFPARVPVMHADLYRLERAEGLGLEDYLESHLSLIEWPDRLDSRTREGAWRVAIVPHPEGREIRVSSPDDLGTG